MGDFLERFLILVLRTQRGAISAFTRVFDALCLFAAWCAAEPGPSLLL
jgi:hypothetical protein